MSQRWTFTGEDADGVRHYTTPHNQHLRLGRGSYCREPLLPFPGGEVTVGRYTSIAPGCGFLTGEGVNHPPAVNPMAVTSYDFGIPTAPGAPITIGSSVWVGMYAIFLPGVSVGDGAIIGASCTVAKDVPPYAVCVGNPMQVKRYRFDPYTVQAILQIRWWDWPREQIDEARAAGLFEDVGAFVRKYG